MPLKRRRLQVEFLEQRRLLTVDLSLIRYFDTWGEGAMGSTDPAGLAYHPGLDRLYVADSEINERNEHFEGANIFEVSLLGDVTHRAIESGNAEPTGITYNAFDGYFYIANDDSRSVERYDANLNSPLASVDTRVAVPTAEDPEGIASDPATGALYVVDGKDGGLQVLVYDSDLQFQYHFPISNVMSDGEGIALDPVSGNLLIVSAKDQGLFEFEITGKFVRKYDLEGITPGFLAPEGLVYAPTSDPLDDAAELSLYIADGMIDNHPDGRIYEVHISRSPPGTETIRTRVATSSDDAEERASGWITTNNPDLELVDDASHQTVGVRFVDLGIPQGATILSAYVQFQVDEATAGEAMIVIQGESVDDAATFTTSSGSVSVRPRTAASVGWAPAAWDKVGAAHFEQRTPDLASVVQEIVSRPGWAVGNAIAMIFSGVGTRVAESFDGDPTGAPLLHVEYATTSEPQNGAPAVEAGVDQQVTLPNSLNLSGTVTDDGLPGGALATAWSQVSGPGTASFGDASLLQTTASFSLPGVYVLRLTADDGELVSFDELTVTVAEANGAVRSIEVRVSSSEDDAEERASRWITTNNPDLELVYDGGNQTVGIRFADLNLPSGATILNAYVQFQTDEASSGAAALVIQGENVDDAAAFSTTAGSLSSRPRTTASAPWSPAPWNTIGEAGLDQRTPNLASVVQEIVNRPGWGNASSLALIITGTGARIAESYDGDPTAAPLLHVEYFGGEETTLLTIHSESQTESLEPDARDWDGAAGGGAAGEGPNRLDVNRDGRISPLDFLLVANQLNRGVGEAEAGSALMQHTLDVNGDQILSPLDALPVMNYLNRQRAAPSDRLPFAERGSAASLAAAVRQATDDFFHALEEAPGALEW